MEFLNLVNLFVVVYLIIWKPKRESLAYKLIVIGCVYLVVVYFVVIKHQVFPTGNF